MTKPARSVFRAIAAFARHVTPSAPGSLSSSKSGPMSPPDSEDVAGVLVSPTENEQSSNKMLFTSTPPQSTPAESSAEKQLDSEMIITSHRQSEDSLRNTAETEDPIRESLSDQSSRQHSVSLAGHQPTAGSSRTNDSIRLPPPRSVTTATSGDVAGPRFGDGAADKDSRIRVGMAGHYGVYHGVNVCSDCHFKYDIDEFQPFDGHMIRERVNPDGYCRPLEPESDLPALTMPRDQVGMIKEGPALRYLNGQALWDKKFSRALKSIAKHRKRNLDHSRNKDAGKISSMWLERVERHHGESHRRMTNGDGTDWETDREKDGAEALLDQSWSWSWALKGEAPPPSAIVSRRDFVRLDSLALRLSRG